MKRVAAWLARRPVTLLLGVALLTLAAGLALVDPATGRLKLEVDSSTEGLVAPDDPVKQFYEQTRRIFGGDDPLIVVLARDDVFSPAGLASVLGLTRRLEDLVGVSRVLSLSTATNIHATKDGDVEIGPFFEQVPETPEGFEAIRRATAANPIFSGSLVSPDHRATALLVYFEGLSDRGYLESGLDASIEAIAREEAAGAEVWISGVPHVKVALSAAVVRNLVSILPLIFGIAALVLWVAFRSLTGVLVPLGTIALALFWSLGAVAWMGRPLNLVTSIVPPLIITLGFSYAMHLVSEYYDVLARDSSGTTGRELIRETLEGVGLPIVITGLTTVLGFVSLAASSMPAVREFGIFSVIGVLAAALATLTFAPAALALVGTSSRPPEVSPSLSRLAGRAAEFSYRNRRLVLGVGWLVFAIAVVGTLRIHVGADHIRNFSPHSPVRTDYDRINDAFGGANPFTIVVETPGRDSLIEPANLSTIRELQGWLEEQPEIGGTTSIVDFLMLLNRALNEDDPKAYEVPRSQRLAKQLLFFGAGEEVDRLIDGRYRTGAIAVRARVNESGAMAGLLDRVQVRLGQLPAHFTATPTGDIVVMNQTLDAIARNQFMSIGLALLTIYLVLSAMFADLRIGLLALFPNVLPIAIFFGILGFGGVALSASTSLIACIALGIAVDDTIHYFARFNSEAKVSGPEAANESTLRGIIRPVTFTTVGLCLGFLALSTSELRNQIHFGLLASATLACAWLIDVTVTPALCSRLRIVTLWDVLVLDLGEEPHRSIPLFAGLTPRQARIAALMLSIVELPAKAGLFREGDEGREMYVILSGDLHGSVVRDGVEIELASMGRGDSVGEIGLFFGKRTANVSAVTDARLLRLSNVELETLAKRYPRIGARIFHNLNHVLSERLVRTTEKVR